MSTAKSRKSAYMNVADMGALKRHVQVYHTSRPANLVYVCVNITAHNYWLASGIYFVY